MIKRHTGHNGPETLKCLLRDGKYLCGALPRTRRYVVDEMNYGWVTCPDCREHPYFVGLPGRRGLKELARCKL